jgi:hypothetical protein
MLSHGNIISMISSSVELGIKMKSDDIHISYLPLAHIFERAVQTILYGEGGSIGFFRGEVPLLFDDIASKKILFYFYFFIFIFLFFIFTFFLFFTFFFLSFETNYLSFCTKTFQ